MQLNFLNYILHEKKQCLIHRFFEAQCKILKKKDFVSSVKKTITDIDLNMNYEEMKMTKKSFFKKFVDKKENIVAILYLIAKVKSKEKKFVYKKSL